MGGGRQEPSSAREGVRLCAARGGLRALTKVSLRESPRGSARPLRALGVLHVCLRHSTLCRIETLKKR